MNINATVRGYFNDAARAFDRAPTEVALAVLTAITLSYGIEHSETGDEVAHFVVATVLLIGVAWSATLMHALGGLTRRTRWLLVGGGVLAAAAYLLLTHNLQYGSEGWRAFMLVSAAVLLVFSAPALPPLPDDANLRLRRINGRVLVRLIGITLYGLALFAGLALALAAIDNLFELKLRQEIYAHVFVWIMVVLVPWVVAGGIDYYAQPLAEESEITRVAHRLVTYLVPLLVAIYFFILYAYVIRIAVTGELPRNLVSPMVIASGLLSLLSIILFDPRPDAKSWRWLRFTPIAYLPLVPLGFWALSVRFQDYGWTEFRALRVIVLLALAALAIVMAVYVLRRRAFPLRVIPLVLSVVLLLAAVGPWSVLAVSRRDQQQRLAAALREAGVNPAARPDPADTTSHRIPQALYNRIASGSSYLSRNFGSEAVQMSVPAYTAGGRFADLIAYFRLAPTVSDTATQTYYARFGTRSALSGGAAYRIQLPDQNAAQARATFARDTLFILAGADSLRVDMRPAMTDARTVRLRGPATPGDLGALPATDRTGARRGDLLVLDMMLTQENRVRRMVHLDAILLVHNTQ